MNAKFLALLEEMEQRAKTLEDQVGHSTDYKIGYSDGIAEFSERLEEILKSYGAFL